MAPLDSWAHSATETCIFFEIWKFQNLIFLPDLELEFVFFVKIKLNGILTVIFEL